MDFSDFEDDFIDDDMDEEQEEEPAPQPAEAESEPTAPVNTDNLDDADSLPPEVAPDVTDIFSKSEKLNTLNMSLKFSNTVTNQLYSLLFCVNQDVELLMARNRTSIPFSVQTEAISSGIPGILVEGGVVKHKKFIDGFQCTGMSDSDAEDLCKFIDLHQEIIRKGFPAVVDKSVSLLKDPLIRSHNTLRTLKQKINDLKKSNYELSVQTRHTANRLVKMSKSGKSEEVVTDKSDVIIQQQRLQKALSRVYNLREANESTTSSNAQLQAQLDEATARAPKSSRPVPKSVIDLQKHVADLTANIEQSEEERETAMAQRRVSLTRMSKGIEKIEKDNSSIEGQIADVENKLRIMTQGKSSGSPGPKRAINPTGSKIPVFHNK